MAREISKPAHLTPRVSCAAETIGPVASYPSVDMSKLNNGEGAEGAAPVLKTQMLPDNGVLWNLDRIDQRTLPLDREYTSALAPSVLRCCQCSYSHSHSYLQAMTHHLPARSACARLC